MSEETNFVPGLTCRILPLCPILDLTEYEDSNEYFVPGVTCQPRPDIFGLENENFRVDLSELPDFSPDYYLEESARGSFDNVPGKNKYFVYKACYLINLVMKGSKKTSKICIDALQFFQVMLDTPYQTCPTISPYNVHFFRIILNPFS